MQHLPVIDIAPLYGNDADAWHEVAGQIDQACRTWGFFYIEGHPISAERLEALAEHAKHFFALSREEKLQIDITRSQHHRGYGSIATEQLDPTLPADLKETFDMGFHMPEDHPDVLSGKPLRGPNRHPRQLEGWADLLEAHYRDMHELGQTLLRAIALALGIDREFFAHRFHEPISVLRLIHYPARPANSPDNQPGAGAHTDYGCITLLHQDQTGGLQVRSLDGKWIDAPPLCGTFVVNIGDMMARWSNDRYRSTPHRVISPVGTQRYSMPYFVEPHPDTEIRCLEGCHSAGNPPKYAPISCSDYMLARFADTYAYRRAEATHG